MASYHFRVKSDKKSDGTKISASVHVDYIQRQGKFKNEGAEKNFENNLITAEEKIFGNKTFPLYLTDDFGKIISTPRGMEVNGKSSPTTLSIALMLAKNLYKNQPLEIKGSKKFCDKVLNATVENNLDVKFADENLQKKFEKLKEQKKNEERKFQECGGKIITTRPIPKSDVKKFEQRTISDVAGAGFNLQTMSAKFMDAENTADATDLLLSSDEFDKLDKIGRKNNFNVRWNFSSEQRNLAEQTAKTILKNLSEMKTEILAASHFEYINREAAYAKRGDCIFSAHQLPSWAKNNPKKFFEAADKYEGANRRRYVEIEFSLPNELSEVEDYKKIIDKFLDKHLKNHYYAYAIHEKLGAISGERHPHVHIMFSERLIDDVEKIQERSPENYFKYPARKKSDGSEPTFEEKFSHGAPKDSKWSFNSRYVAEMRADFAKIQNEVLQEKGFSVRVDHRSLKTQKAEAERNGDKFLAKLLDREPEKYLRMSVPVDEKNPRIEKLKKYREFCHQQAELLYSADLVLQKSAEKKIKKSVRDIFTATKNFSDLDSSEEISKWKMEILKLTREVNAWKRSFISADQAELQAKFEYMTKAEKKLWIKFHDLQSQRDNLQKFLQECWKPASYQTEQLKIYNEICSETEKKIKNLETAINLLRPSIEQLNQKFSSPSFRRNIQLATHNILNQNFFVRENLKKATEKLNLASENLQEKIFQPSNLKNMFTLKEIYDILRRQYFGLKKEQEKLSVQEKILVKKMFTTARAKKMAENIFVNGAWKKLREEVRKFEKQKNSLHPLQMKYLEKKLGYEKERLESLCSTPDVQKKILEITTGILRKNEKFSKEFTALKTRKQNLSAKINQLHGQLVGIKCLLSRPRTNSFYKIVSANGEKNKSVGKIFRKLFSKIKKSLSTILILLIPKNFKISLTLNSGFKKILTLWNKLSQKI